MGDLTGKVAVITGAGRGLGREEAIQLAKQGARVVINDIGLPDAIEAAQSAVEEIKSFGGEAMAVYGDCADSADAENLLKTTLDSYGDMNIMINNAGFCRDKTIFGMSDEEFDSVVRVHLRGHFVNMRNATKYWREKAKAGDEVYGRLISTSSEAALYGSAGQPNYAAAKAGIVAMTMGAAQLLIKYGITANVIMPRALTDMTAGGQTAEMFATACRWRLFTLSTPPTWLRWWGIWPLLRPARSQVRSMLSGVMKYKWPRGPRYATLSLIPREQRSGKLRTCTPQWRAITTITTCQYGAASQYRQSDWLMPRLT